MSNTITVSELLQLLLASRRVRHRSWDAGHWVWLNEDGELVDEAGQPESIIIGHDDQWKEVE